MSDEIVLEYLERVKQENEKLLEENEGLKKAVAKRVPTNIKLIDFSNLKDIWSSIFHSEGWSIFTALVMTVLITYGLIFGWQAYMPDDPPEPAKILSGNFYVQGNSYNDCYLVVQEYNSGGSMANSPCIKDMDEAVRLRTKLETAYKENHLHEHKDIRSLPSGGEK